VLFTVVFREPKLAGIVIAVPPRVFNPVAEAIGGLPLVRTVKLPVVLLITTSNS
jgi:hypothetical protein